MRGKLSQKTFKIPRWEEISFLVHGFGTRHFKQSDIPAEVEGKAFELILLEQQHSDGIHILKKTPEVRLEGDALGTDQPGLLLCVRTADCLPVLMVSESKRLVAAVHCGWRGTCRRLIQKVVQKLTTTFHCDRSSLLVALGPSIEPDCYEVGPEVRESFLGSELPSSPFRDHPAKPGKLLLDLKSANRDQLLEIGIEGANISAVNRCTYCDDNLFSYRRGILQQRLLNFIGLSL